MKNKPIIELPSLGYKEDFTVRAYEIDSQKRATLPAIVQLMQESAMQNVIRLKLSVWDLEPHSISWVLMRKKMTVHRLPILGEKITVVTYPAGFEKFFTYRDYKVFAENGDLLTSSSSTWLLMDMAKRRMTRIPDFIKENFEPSEEELKSVLERPNIRLDVSIERVDFAKDFVVNYYDLDFNEHLNNVQYLKWMLEALPNDYLNHYHIKSLDILYRSECRLGDRVISEIQQLEENIFLHRLRLEADGKELMTARTVWGRERKLSE